MRMSEQKDCDGLVEDKKAERKSNGRLADDIGSNLPCKRFVHEDTSVLQSPMK